MLKSSLHYLALCSTAISLSAQAQTIDAQSGLEHIEVKGRAQTLYRASSSSLATRTNTPLDEVPQNVQVLPEALIQDQAARQITDLYRSMSGVSNFSYSGVTFRGFRQDDILYDGVRGDPFNGFAVPQLFNIEEIQLLKGPAGALYGSGSPGGVINYTTKKPTAVSRNQLKLGLGNDDFISGSVELSGPLTQQADHRYRIGYYQDSEKPFRVNTKIENNILDLGYAFDLTQDTTLTLQYTDIEQDYAGARIRGIYTDSNGHFVGSRHWNHNEKTDYQLLDSQVYQAKLEHQFNTTWFTDFTVRHYKNQELQNYHEPYCSYDTNQDGIIDYCRRQFRQQQRNNEATSLTWNNIVEITTGSFEHTLLLGADHFEQNSDFAARNALSVENRGPVPGLSLLNPQYGLTSAADYNLEALPLRRTNTEAKRSGVYLQDQITLSSQWNILLSIRWDNFKDLNKLDNTTVSGNDMSWRAGTTYQLTDWIRLYALVATGFLPQTAEQQHTDVGGPFDAETSRIYEAGLRFSILDDAVRLNTAIYQINRKNILQLDPRGDVAGDGRDDLLPLGEVRSRGFELDLMGDLSDNWVLNANYAFNDTKVMHDYSGITNATGGTFANAPRHQIGLWSRYDLPHLNSAIAAGLDYVSKQQSIDGHLVRSYSIFDISWQTEWHNWQFQLNIKNLLDKTYASSGFISRSGHFPGEPRRIYLTTTYKF